MEGLGDTGADSRRGVTDWPPVAQDRSSRIAVFADLIKLIAAKQKYQFTLLAEEEAYVPLPTVRVFSP